MKDKEINLIHQVLLAEVKIQKVRCRQLELMNRLQQMGIIIGYTDNGVISAWTSDGRYYDLSAGLELNGGHTDFQKMKASLLQVLRAESELEKLMSGALAAAGEASEIGDDCRS